MRPVIAQKKTQCYFCKDDIPAGAKRLTDTLTKNVKGQKRFFTRHFCFRKEPKPEQGMTIQVSCMEKWASQVFAKLPLDVRTNNPNGRPKLDITEEQRVKRTKLLKSLRNQVRYYISDGNLDLTPKYPTEINVKDVKKAKRFHGNIAEIFKELETCGGIPLKYKDYASSVL